MSGSSEAKRPPQAADTGAGEALDALASAIRALSDPDQIEAEACRRIAEHVGADRVYYAEIDEEAGVSRVRRDFRRSGDTLAGEHQLCDFAFLINTLREDRTFSIADTRTAPDMAAAERDACAEIGIVACIGAPVTKDGVLVGTLCATSAAPRDWTPDDVALLKGAAEWVWSAMERAGSRRRHTRMEAVLRGIAEGTGDLIAALDFDYRILFRNDAYAAEFEKLWGHRIKEGESLLEHMPKWPEEREKARRVWARALAGETFNVVMEFGPSDAEMRFYDLRFSPVRDASGTQIGAAHIFRDVTEETRSAALMENLVHELQHRTANLLNVVQSVARRTRANSASLEEFDRAFTHRLQALARVNALLSELEGVERVSFNALLRAELEAQGLSDPAGLDARIALDGPDMVMLASARVQTFALVLHELVANAKRHGALSCESGRVSIHWRLEDGDRPRRLILDWRETGGPATQDTDRRGFGRELIERALPVQMDAETRFELTADGLHCTVTAPVSRQQAEIES